MFRFALLLGLSALAPLRGQVVPGRFIVELTGPPLEVLARTRAASAEKAARSAGIASAQRAASHLVENRGGRVLASMSSVMNGLVVDGGGLDERTLAGLPGVAKVYPVDTVTLHLDHALPLHLVPGAWNAVGGSDKAGAGIRIGILDTGISPDHPAFRAASPALPPGFPRATPEDNLAYTGGKIIVARDYRILYQVTDPDDVRDRYGHGTAVAMCAAGARNEGPWGTITGVAPEAWIGVYKISRLDSGSSSSDVIVKAIDDAVADGMDVINISSGSSLVRTLEESPLARAIERATSAGAIVVVSAGNAGSALGTVADMASVPAAISVGASDSDRLFGAGVELPGTTPKTGVARSGNLPDAPVSGVLKDVQTVDPGSTACSPLPEGSLTGAIAIATAAGCLYENKLRNLENAGAAGAVIYTSSASSNPVIMLVGEAKLPAVMVGFDDGRALRSAAADNPDGVAKVWFRGLAFPNESRKLRATSSRGPTNDHRIKPDISATGYVYTATQKLNEAGSMYNASSYVATSGTSFSAPIVAGAAAVLKAARPGLTVEQYRSLLINRAAILDTPGTGIERVQRTGNGTLDLLASLGGTLAAVPTSLSFGIGGASVERIRELRLTNLSKAADTYGFNVSRFDGAAPPLFSLDQGGSGAAENLTVKLDPGETRTVYAFWKPDGLLPGEYQGIVAVQGTGEGSSVLVPYWYGVPSNSPVAFTVVQSPSAAVTAGQAASAYFRVIDESGIAITDPEAFKYEGTVTAGSGTMSSPLVSTTYPGLLAVTLRTGAAAGRNSYRVSFAGLPPVTLTVEGRAAQQ